MNVIPVQLPALRERGNDILLLANAILADKSSQNNKDFKQFSAEVQKLFLQYDWPGNIRELQNVIENMVVIHTGESITTDMLPATFGQSDGEITKSTTVAKRSTQHIMAAEKIQPIQGSSAGIIPMWLVEKNTIEHAIEACSGNIPLAAAHLGVSASTIYRKMKSWDAGNV